MFTKTVTDRTIQEGHVYKPRQHLCYVYASLSRLGFRGLPEKLFIVFEGVIGFSTAKKPTALMMHWWNGGRGGVCDDGCSIGDDSTNGMDIALNGTGPAAEAVRCRTSGI